MIGVKRRSGLVFFASAHTVNEYGWMGYGKRFENTHDTSLKNSDKTAESAPILPAKRRRKAPRTATEKTPRALSKILDHHNAVI
jgi:hypothetical protein